MLRATLLAALLFCSACKIVAPHDEASDRAEIHALLVDYGRTLDDRDFAGFSALFASNGVYVAGGGTAVSGRDADELMKKTFAENALGFRSPNFHVFFNEVVVLDGPDRAHASSMSLYMVPDEHNRPSPALMAHYEDELVRENGQWKFLRRTVRSLIPAPPRPA